MRKKSTFKRDLIPIKKKTEIGRDILRDQPKYPSEPIDLVIDTPSERKLNDEESKNVVH